MNNQEVSTNCRPREDYHMIDLDEINRMNEILDIEQSDIPDFTDSIIDSYGNDHLEYQTKEEDILSPSLDNLLAYNLAYQELLTEEIQNIELLLTDNLERQKMLESKPETEVATSKGVAGYSCNTFAMPYFKDVMGMTSPMNPDGLNNQKMVMLDPFICPPKIWYRCDRKHLQSYVRANKIDRFMEKIKNKIDYLEDKHLKCEIAEEKAKILDAIGEYEKKINQINDDKILTPEEEADIEIDWLKIAATDFLGSRDSDSCRLMWEQFLRDDINKKRWTSIEDQVLEKLVVSMKDVCWDTVSIKLETNRTAFQCIERYFSKIKPTFKTGPWTIDEEKFLLTIIEFCSVGGFIPWNQVAYYLESRSRELCMNKWCLSLNPSYLRGQWKESEDLALITAVNIYGPIWSLVSSYVKTRHSQQCRDRYLFCIQPHIKFGNFTEEEDDKLRQLIDTELTETWTHIAEKFPGRTSRTLRQRYHYLKKHSMPELAERNPKTRTQHKVYHKVAKVHNKFQETLTEVAGSSASSTDKSRKLYALASYNQCEKEVESPLKFKDLFNNMKLLRLSKERGKGGRPKFDIAEIELNSKIAKHLHFTAYIKKFARCRPLNRNDDFLLAKNLEEVLITQSTTNSTLPLFPPNHANMLATSRILYDEPFMKSEATLASKFTKCIEDYFSETIDIEEIMKHVEHYQENYTQEKLKKMKEQFDKLESHFTSLFTWPLAMSTTEPNEKESEMESEKVDKVQTKTKSKYRYKPKKVKKPWIKQIHKEKRLKKISEGLIEPIVEEKTEGATPVKRKRKRNYGARVRESSRIKKQN